MRRPVYEHVGMPLCLAAIVVLLAAGCGMADDFARTGATPSCQAPACPAETAATPAVAGVSSSATAESTTADGLPARPATAVATPASSPPLEPASAPGAFASTAAVLGPVIWATTLDPVTNAPLNQVTSFSPEARVLYAAVAVGRARAGTVLGARWAYNETRLEGFDDSITLDSPHDGVWIEFHLALGEAGAWPQGAYALEITVDGEPAVTGRVDVVSPGP